VFATSSIADRFFGCVKALAKHGLPIREDGSLVAFDNTEIGRTTMKSLTTFDIGRREIADTALSLMLRRLQGDTAQMGRHYVHSKLVEGDTVRWIGDFGARLDKIP